MSELVSCILAPVRVGVHYACRNGENTAKQLGFCFRMHNVLVSPIVFKATERIGGEFRQVAMASRMSRCASSAIKSGILRRPSSRLRFLIEKRTRRGMWAPYFSMKVFRLGDLTFVEALTSIGMTTPSSDATKSTSA